MLDDQTFTVRKAQIAPLLAQTFPEYRGRTFKVEFRERVTFGDLHWDGGTRSCYKFLDMRSGDTQPLPVGNPWNCPFEGKTLELPEDVVVVEHSIFCGQDTGITFYAHPSRQRALMGA